jgi:hypothetical protein
MVFLVFHEIFSSVSQMRTVILVRAAIENLMRPIASTSTVASAATTTPDCLN